MKTIEEILQERLAAPVRQKSGAILTNDQGEPLLPLEAMIMSVMTNAMRGDIAAIAFIQNLTKKQAPDDPAWRAYQQQQLIENIADIKAQLDADHIYEPSTDVEIDRLANSLLIIQRLEAKMRESGHEDITTETNRSGQQSARLSIIDDLRNKLLKQFNADLRQLRQDAQNRFIMRRQNERVINRQKS